MNVEVAARQQPVASAHLGFGHIRSKADVRLRFYIAALLCDIFAISLSFCVANMIRFGQVNADAGIKMVLILTPLYLGFAASANIYSSLSIMNYRKAALLSAFAYIKATAVLLFVVFFFKASDDLSRLILFIGSGIALCLLLLLRYAFRKLSLRVFGETAFHTICISDGIKIETSLAAEYIDARIAALEPNVLDPHALDRIGGALKLADQVIVYCSPDRRQAWASVLKGTDVHAEIIVPELEGLGSLGAKTYEGLPTLAIAIPSLDMRSRILKRVLDLSIAASALMVLAPLMLLTALAIRLDSPGNILFVQPRLGRGNRLFPMYKFRSMRTEACDVAGAVSTGRQDSRVTRIGRIIRATSIDELPQLLNVFTGDMSIVGPRPHALGSLAGDKLFWEVDQRYWHRHAAKPGITGLAQVRGFRGATHAQSDLLGRLQSDLEYLNGWSIWRDISILFATVRVVRHTNAY